MNIWKTARILPAAARRWGVLGAATRAFRVLQTEGPRGLTKRTRYLAVTEARARSAATGSRRFSTVLLLHAAIRRWGAVGMLRRAVHVWQTGGSSAVFTKVHDLASLESGTVSHATGVLQLDTDFGVSIARWQHFMAQRMRAFDDTRTISAGIRILITGAEDSAKAAATLQSIEKTGLPTRSILVGDVSSFSDQLRTVMADADAGDLIWFLRAGDIVHRTASRLFAEVEAAHADLCLFDTYFSDGDRIYPQLHPGFNEIFGLNCDYFRSRFVARVDAVRRTLGSVVPEQAYGVARALLSARYRGEGIAGIHIPDLCVQIDESRASLSDDSRALIDARSMIDWGAVARDHWADRDKRVSIIICTRNNGQLLRQLVRSILETAGDLVCEVVIVSHHTKNPYAMKTLTDLREDPRVRILRYEGPFNFSRQCNLAAREATAPYLMFLNDDIIPISADWLSQLLQPFDNPSVGVTGPLLIYPNESVQHAGMFLGYYGMAGHTLRAARLPYGDYLFMTQAPREVSCLTGAAMVIERQLFDDLNGFDSLLGTYLQDVDLSLRVGHLGRRLVFNPRAVLFHVESSTIQPVLKDASMIAIRDLEKHHFTRRWAADLELDPFHNSNLDVGAESLRLVLPEPRNIRR